LNDKSFRRLPNAFLAQAGANVLKKYSAGGGNFCLF